MIPSESRSSTASRPEFSNIDRLEEKNLKNNFMKVIEL